MICVSDPYYIDTHQRNDRSDTQIRYGYGCIWETRMIRSYTVQGCEIFLRTTVNLNGSIFKVTPNFFNFTP